MTEKDLSLYNLILKVKEKGLKQMKAAELLGVSDRHFRRILKSYKEEGIEGLLSKKRGMKNRRLKEEIRGKIIEKLKSSYTDCGPTFAWEKLVKIEGIKVSMETVRKIMIEEGLWESKKKQEGKVTPATEPTRV